MANDQGDATLEDWRHAVAAAEADLREREQLALQGEPTPEELAAFAAEHDKLGDERDALADAFDARARGRDVRALDRDVAGSGRDRAARQRADDRDEGAPDRFIAGEDRDFAAGDRGDSFDDRARATDSRRAAAGDRQRAAYDREQAAGRATDAAAELAGLQQALETRMTIGQAQGLLMSRYGLDTDESFRLLVRLSQTNNVKVRDVAAEIVDDATREAQESPRQHP